MWSEQFSVQANPIALVSVKGSSKCTRQPRSLTVEQFHRLVRNLREPFRTMALVCVCLGLRISELLALRWGDVDWFAGTL
jgi:integrase